MKLDLRLLVFLSALALVLPDSRAAGTTVFQYTSSPQSFIGGGQTVSVTPADGFTFTIWRDFDNGAHFTINNFATAPNSGPIRSFLLDFAAPFNVPLSVGAFTGATRWPFQDPGVPGLSFAANGNGNNTLTGSFSVFEAAYSPSGDLVAFAADFTQFDGGAASRWNFGSIRYNSSIPVTPVPEPASLLLLAMGMAGVMAWASRRRVLSRSSAPAGPLASK